MVDLEDIRQARERITGTVKTTPCLTSEVLSQYCGMDLRLKLETLQRTGSFKPRGAVNKVLSLTGEQRQLGVVAASAGNHAQGLAFAARSVEVPALIVMPEATPLVKITRTRDLGAEVVLFGRNLDESLTRARELEQERDLVFVHPFDDELIIAGQGTVGLEILEQEPDVEAVVIPIGGGGLISGVATAIKTLRPEVEVYGVQSEAAPSMKRSYDGGHWTAADVGPTIAEGITLKQPGRITYPIIQRLVDGIELVSEAEIEGSIFELLNMGKTLVEGAGAAGYCALRNGRFPRLAGRKVVVVLCGGNIDLNILERIIERSLLRQSRLVRLRITVPDRPGGLADLLQFVAGAEANLLQVRHQRVFTSSSFWQVDVELTLETRNREHIDNLLESLREAGYGRLEELGVPLVPGPRLPR